MRIIAGKYRGRQIAAPDGDRTRPITDRAKTVLFDILGDRLDRPGSLPPLAVLDLFAGSGSLGIEALSRGARFALFVEQHRPTAALIRRNLDSLGIPEDQGRVLAADAARCAFPPPPGSPPVYSLVFLDPPYRLLEGPSADSSLRPLIHKLAADPLIADDAIIVVRHAEAALGGPNLAPLVEIERRDVGSMTFRFMGPGRVPSLPSRDASPVDDQEAG
jgi:16S rRNA (guanine966-N2)-methyltransferase